MKILKPIIAMILVLNCAAAFSSEQKTDFLSFKDSDFRACDVVHMAVDEATPEFEALIRLAISGPVQRKTNEMIFFDDTAVEYNDYMFYVGPAVNDANMAPFLEAMNQMALLPGFRWSCQNYN
ncbi:MAG: hypothetical protein ACXVLQ_01340 [Bacteriovorax sp.]